MKNIAILVSIIGLLCQVSTANAFGKTYLGSASCPGADKIYHTPGQHWSVSDPDWIIQKEDITSSVKQFSPETTTTRKMSPYSFSNSSIADVSCNYQDTLELKRTFTKDKPLYAGAGFISAADGRSFAFDALFWIVNDSTSCTTSFAALEKCSWDFYPDPDYHFIK